MPTDDEDQGQLPKPTTTTEWILSKSNSLSKLFAQRQLELDRKVDEIRSMLAASGADSRVVAEQIDRLIEFERDEHADLRDLRNSIADQHVRIVTAGHDLVEARKGIDGIREDISEEHPLLGKTEIQENFHQAWASAKWAWKTARKVWPALLAGSAGGAGIYHAIRTWLGG